MSVEVPSRARTFSRLGSSRVTRNTVQVSADAQNAADRMPSFASASRVPWKASEAMSRATVKPIPAIAPAPATAAQPTGGWMRPRLSAADQPRGPGGAERLAHHVADQDAERDRGRVGLREQPHADRHARVGQGEQRHDEIARPRVVQLLEPLVGGDGQGDAVTRLTGQLRGGLLAEQPEQVTGPLQVAAGCRAGVGEQAHDQAHHHRVHAGLEERHPGRHPEQEVPRAEPHAGRPDGGHHHAGCPLPRTVRAAAGARCKKSR